MNRLQKKCIIATMGFHLLLAVVLLAGSAFRSPQSEPEVTPVTLYPTSTLPTEPSLPVQRQVEYSKPLLPVITPKTSAPLPQFINQPKSPPHVVIPVFTPAMRPAPAHSVGSSGGAPHESLVDPYKAALTNLANNLTTGAQIKIPDFGAEMDPNYAVIVKRKYQTAWMPPGDAANDDAIAKVSVAIDKDGRVMSTRILTPSGDANVDASVQQTLDRVNFIAPFPDGAKEKERIFIINFNLKAKRMLG